MFTISLSQNISRVTCRQIRTSLKSELLEIRVREMRSKLVKLYFGYKIHHSHASCNEIHHSNASFNDIVDAEDVDEVLQFEFTRTKDFHRRDVVIDEKFDCRTVSCALCRNNRSYRVLSRIGYDEVRRRMQVVPSALQKSEGVVQSKPLLIAMCLVIKIDKIFDIVDR